MTKARDWKPKLPPPLQRSICDTCGGGKDRTGRCISCYIEGRRANGREVTDKAEQERLKKERKALKAAQDKRRWAKETRKRKAREANRVGQKPSIKCPDCGGKKVTRVYPGVRTAREIQRQRKQFIWMVEALLELRRVVEKDEYGRFVVYEDSLNKEAFEEKIWEIDYTIPGLMKSAERIRKGVEVANSKAEAMRQTRALRKKEQQDWVM